MKPNQLATLVLRLLRVYSLVEAIPLLVINTSSAVAIGEPVDSGNSNAALITWLILPPIFRIGIGIFLFVWAEALSDKLVPREVNDKSGSSISFEDVQALAFAVVGVLVFAGALPQSLRSVFDLVQTLTDHEVYWASKWRSATVAIGTILEAALGLALFFRARGFAGFWRSLKTFATPKPPQA